MDYFTAADIDNIASLSARLGEVDCDVDLRDESGATALHRCASKGNAWSAVHLIERGADVNSRDRVCFEIFTFV